MKPTILVVDDETDIRGLLRTLLQRAGYAVVEAATGSEVEAAVMQHAPGLVLLDVMLPGLDGYDVCRRLKTNPATRHVPILMQTALRGRTEELRAMGAGADGFLSKPINRADLLAHVQAHVRVDRDNQERTDQRGPVVAARGGVLGVARDAPSRATPWVAAVESEAATLRHDLYAMLQSIHNSAAVVLQRHGDALDRDGARTLHQIRADALRARRLLARLGER